jgi:hypothetical protein
MHHYSNGSFPIPYKDRYQGFEKRKDFLNIISDNSIKIGFKKYQLSLVLK